MAVQSFSDIVISWTGLPDEPCPITNYTITINGSPVTVAGNDNRYTRPITDECGSTIEINMFATNAAGPGNTTATNLTIVAAGEWSCMVVTKKKCSFKHFVQFGASQGVGFR